MSKTVPIILASASRYRQQLLARLAIEFEAIAADIDESRRQDECPNDYVLRLAQEKAAKIAQTHPNQLIIGSDQCALIEGEIVGKPGNRQAAIDQLQRASGKEITLPAPSLRVLYRLTARPSFQNKIGNAAIKRTSPMTTPVIAPPIRLNHDSLVISVNVSSDIYCS